MPPLYKCYHGDPPTRASIATPLIVKYLPQRRHQSQEWGGGLRTLFGVKFYYHLTLHHVDRSMPPHLAGWSFYTLSYFRFHAHALLIIESRVTGIGGGGHSRAMPPIRFALVLAWIHTVLTVLALLCSTSQYLLVLNSNRIPVPVFSPTSST